MLSGGLRPIQYAEPYIGQRPAAEKSNKAAPAVNMFAFALCKFCRYIVDNFIPHPEATRFQRRGAVYRQLQSPITDAGRFAVAEAGQKHDPPATRRAGECRMRLKDAMMTTNGQSAADRYAARVDAVLAQRTRLRGPQPPGDQRAGCPADNPLAKADPLRPLDPNLAVIASYIEADDVIIDVGGGAGRISLPLALRCREVINVGPSPTMRIGFRKNAAAAGISNARIVEGEWPSVDAPAGSVALVNHVTYLTREIVPFIERLEQAGRRRILITVNSVPPPSFQRVLYQLVHGEAERVVPGHVELINVIWELGILPDIRVSPSPSVPLAPAAGREAAIAGAVARFPGEQWGWWSLGSDLESRLRSILEARFDELFTAGPEGFVPRYITPGREILITWQPQAESQAR